MPTFHKALNRLLSKTAVNTGLAVTLNVGTKANVKGAIANTPSENSEYGAIITREQSISFLIPWGETEELPDDGLRVEVTEGQGKGKFYQIKSVPHDMRVSGGHIVIACISEEE